MSRPGLLFYIALVLFVTMRPLPAPVIEEEQPSPTISSKPKSKASAPAAKQASLSDRDVEVVLSDSGQAALKYLRDYVEHFEKMPFTGKSDVRPDDILPQLRQALSTRFKNVSVANEGSSRGKGGLVMVLDLEAHVGSFSGTHNELHLSGTFKSSDGKVLGSVTGAGKSTVPYPAFHTSFPKALNAAIADFSRNLGQLKR
jgi:hypothetical protein